MTMMRFSILSLVALLAFSTFGASPEYLVGETVPTQATLLRFLPAVASNGTDFFVVWLDTRAGFGSDAIIGTRVTRDGEVLDPLGITIATARFTTSPRLVWDGEAYLVAWTQYDDPNVPKDVYAARVGPHGNVVMPPRLIATDAMTDVGNFVASNGTVSVIAYRTGSSEMKITALDRNGDTLHHETLGDESDWPQDPSVAAGTSRFVVAWNERAGYTPGGDGIKAVALTASGHRIDAPKTVLFGEEPVIASDGARFTIVSRINNDWREYTLSSRTFDGNLAPVSDVKPILTSNQVEEASILWLDSNRYEVFAARQLSPGGPELVSIELDANGNPLQPLRSRGNIAYEPSLLMMATGTNGADVLVARVTDVPPDNKQIVAQLYRGNATAADDEKLLSWHGNAHREPQIASSPLGHFVAWTEDDGVYATRVDRDGNSLDGRGIRLSAILSAYEGAARVAFDGTNYVVAWRDDDFIGVRTIAPLSGATVAETQVPVEGRPMLALAASPAATYLVFTNDERVRVTRIPHDTHTPDPAPLAVSPEDMDVGSVAASWNGSTLLVAWTEENNVDWSDPPQTFSIKIHAARVSASLALLDPAPLLIAATEDPYDNFSPPSIASNGVDWLIVTSFEFVDVLARRVLQNGTVEGSAPMKIGSGVNPVAVWDGVRYAVAWKEGAVSDFERPLVLSAIQPSGPLAAAHRVFVSSASTPRWPLPMPSIASGGNGATAVAYAKVSYRPEHSGVARSFFRVLNLGAQRGRAMRR